MTLLILLPVIHPFITANNNIKKNKPRLKPTIFLTLDFIICFAVSLFSICESLIVSIASKTSLSLVIL